MKKRQKTVSHVVGLSGIGGVQSNFVEYINNVNLGTSIYRHKVYTFGDVDIHYQLTINVLNVRKISNLYQLILDIISKDTIVHFYNNLSSFKIACLLMLLPVKGIIFHERGTIWNQKSIDWIIPRFIGWKSTIILSNSIATKTMLVKKFSFPKEKIKILHNGINTFPDYKSCCEHKNLDNTFRIGFIGRLDSPKGVHVLIDTMHILKGKEIILFIAGEGALGDTLKKSASSLDNVKFIGRIKSPYVFMSKIDLLVVPSIREPLGNVCLEAGLCKVPVLAANVDGIPEIIKNGITGELIDATDRILLTFPENAIPVPELVVNPVNQCLHPPKQINSAILAKKILRLSKRPKLLEYYADNLYDKVIGYFSIDRYRDELHAIYHKIKL